MSGERWARLEQLFHAASPLDAGTREQFLARECAGDHALRAEVERLLAAHDRDHGFIDEPAVASAASWLDVDATVVERRIGPYRTVREIGRGGMGVVYLAEREDGQFHRRVALKLMKRGMDSEQIASRFRAERQILASLDHPNIARLLDGGTTNDGLPYFVMEHIEGEPIDTWANARGLGVAERLQLFLQVCAAVSYAHQHLVVHRDLKPLNILVTADGAPKLLDFGIAKVLHADGDPATATATGLRLLTPEYASPEQIEGRNATTASDVFSLGIVLYELLTGRTPYRAPGATPWDIAESVRTTQPERPSTVVSRRSTAAGRRLRGDLDTIVLTALRKEPDRRYASVEQLAGDIRRHLDGMPVRARPDTLGYRASKFVRRHRVAVAAGIALALALVGGVVSTAWEARAARAAQARAERRFSDVRELARRVLFDYHDAIKDLPGATPVRARLVRDALQYLDTLASEAQGDRSLQRELASAYRRVGDVQGGSMAASLGDTRGAIESYRKSMSILEALLRADSADVRARRDIADLSTELSSILWEAGELTEARRHASRALAVLEPLAARSPSDGDLRSTLTRAYDAYGAMSLEAGETSTALASHQKQLQMLLALPDSTRRRPAVRRSLSVAREHLAAVYVQLDDLETALSHTREAVALRAGLAEEYPDNADYRRILGTSYFWEGDILARMGRTREALDRHRRNLAILEALAVADPEAYRGEATYAHVQVGDMLARLGNHERALASYRRAYAIRAEDVKADSASLWRRSSLIEARARICGALANLRRTDEASATCAETVVLMEHTAVEPNNAAIRSFFGATWAELGAAYDRLARTARACVMYRRSADVWKDMTRRGIMSPADSSKADSTSRAATRCEGSVDARD